MIICLKENNILSVLSNLFMIWNTSLIIFLSKNPPSYFIFSGLYIPFLNFSKGWTIKLNEESCSENFSLSPQVPRWHNLMASQIIFNFSSFQNWIHYNSFRGFIKWIVELYFCYCPAVKSSYDSLQSIDTQASPRVCNIPEYTRIHDHWVCTYIFFSHLQIFDNQDFRFHKVTYVPDNLLHSFGIWEPWI